VDIVHVDKADKTHQCKKEQKGKRVRHFIMSIPGVQWKNGKREGKLLSYGFEGLYLNYEEKMHLSFDLFFF